MQTAPVFLSIDGNFGLCRKKASRMSTRPPLHGKTIFLDQDEVNKYVADYATIKAPISKVFLPGSLYKYIVY